MGVQHRYTSKEKTLGTADTLTSVGGRGAAHVVPLRDDELCVARRRERVRGRERRRHRALPLRRAAPRAPGAPRAHRAHRASATSVSVVSLGTSGTGRVSANTLRHIAVSRSAGRFALQGSTPGGRSPRCGADVRGRRQLARRQRRRRARGPRGRSAGARRDLRAQHTSDRAGRRRAARPQYSPVAGRAGARAPRASARAPGAGAARARWRGWAARRAAAADAAAGCPSASLARLHSARSRPGRRWPSHFRLAR